MERKKTWGSGFDGLQCLPGVTVERDDDQPINVINSGNDADVRVFVMIYLMFWRILYGIFSCETRSERCDMFANKSVSVSMP